MMILDFVEKLQKAQFKRRLIEAIITAVFLAIAITIQILYDNSKIASAVDESFLILKFRIAIMGMSDNRGSIDL